MQAAWSAPRVQQSSLVVSACLGVLLLSAYAAAQPVTHATADAGANEMEELRRSIAHDAQSLSTEDCTTACKALGSMRRATERLCALDPGAPCTEARDRGGAPLGAKGRRLRGLHDQPPRRTPFRRRARPRVGGFPRRASEAIKGLTTFVAHAGKSAKTGAS